MATEIHSAFARPLNLMYLIDTHVLIWSLFDTDNLSDTAKIIIENDEKIFVSIASLWEMAIKNSIGKLELKQSIKDIANVCNKNGIAIIDITPSHCDSIRELPDIHHDPFDRMLIAQAKAENMSFLTHDSLIPFYEEKCIIPV